MKVEWDQTVNVSCVTCLSLLWFFLSDLWDYTLSLHHIIPSLNILEKAFFWKHDWVKEKMIFVFDGIENIVGKGENACKLLTIQQIFVPNSKYWICTWQTKNNWILKFIMGNGGKHCGKRRKCWLPAFSPFLSMFWKGLFLKVVKSRDCLVKSIFSFSHNVSSGFNFWGHKHVVLFW